MDRKAAIDQIKESCARIAQELMRLNPAVPALGDRAASDDIYKALYQLTKELETIKKRVLRLGQSPDQPDL